MTDIAAVLLDADGVVQHSDAVLKSPVLERLGGTSFLGELWSVEIPLLTGSGEFRPALDALLHERLSSVSLDEALTLWTDITVDHDVLDLVAGLRRAGYRCALATNQQDFRTAHMRSALGYADAFDEQFYSSEIGYAKPDVRFFHGVLDALGLPAGATLFVDDSVANVDGAREAGLLAEWHDPASGAAGLERLLAGHGVEPA